MIVNPHRFGSGVVHQISLVGSPVEASAIDGANVTLNLPVGMQEGDVVYAFFAISTVVGGGTLSSGWTQIGSTIDATCRSQLFRKVMGAVPDTDIVLVASGATNNGAVAVGFALRGVDNATPEDTTHVTTTGSSTNPNPPAITTVTDKAWVLTFAAARNLDATVTAPSGYSNQVDIAADDTNDVTAGGATKEIATGGTNEDPATWTNWGSGPWHTYSVAVRPA